MFIPRAHSSFSALSRGGCVCLCLAFLLPLALRSGELFPPREGGGCGKGDERVMGEIRRLVSSLHAEMEDRLLCGRDPDAPFYPTGCASRTVRLPEFCGFYKVHFTLTASVPPVLPAHPLNYDCRGFFHFSKRGGLVGETVYERAEEDPWPQYPQTDCSPIPLSMRLSMVVEGGEKITLIAIPGTLYPIPFTASRISDVTVEPLKHCGGLPGEGGALPGCASFSASLGEDALGRSAGRLLFEFPEPTPMAFSRHGLDFLFSDDGGASCLLGDDGEGRLYLWNASKSLYEPLSGNFPDQPSSVIAPRRLVLRQCVVDLCDIPGGYEIRYYLPSQALSPEAGEELGGFQGTPFRAWRVRNPSPPEAEEFSAIEVTELRNGAAQSQGVLEYDGEAGEWGLRTGEGEEETWESVGSEEAEGGVLRYRRIRDAQGRTIFYRGNVCHAFPWGEEVVEERTGLSQPRITTHAYYDDPENDGSAYGRLKETVEWDGSWRRLSYDDEGRLGKETTPWLDAPPGSPESLCRVKEHLYGDAFPQETVVERVCGIEVSRTYLGSYDGGGERHVIRASSPGASWDAPGNERSVTHALTDLSSPFHGELLSRTSSDGTALQRSISPNADGTWTVVTLEGRTAGGYSIVSGTRTEELRASDGGLLSREMRDVESGLLLAREEHDRDAFGRTIRIRFADGTQEEREYGCCGPLRTVRRDGSELLEERSPRGLLLSRTEGGVTRTFAYDGAERLMAETLLGAQGGALTTQYEYDEHGDRTATVSPAGHRTEYAIDLAEGRLRETVTYPDGGTETTSRHRDGSLALVSGSATVPRQCLYTVLEGGGTAVRTLYADGTWEESRRDFLGRTVETAWSNSSSETTEYDGMGRVVKRTSPGGVVTLFSYDDAQYGDVVAVDMDGDGALGLYGVDLAEATRTDYVEAEGRVMRRTRTWRWQEDFSPTPALLSQSLESVDGDLSLREEGGRMIRRETLFLGGGALRVTTTAAGVSSPAVEEYREGRLVERNSPEEGRIQYAYDQFGRAAGETRRANGSVQRLRLVLDADGRATSSTWEAGGESRVSHAAYDGAGRPVSQTRPDGSRLLREYDPMGNLIREDGDAWRLAFAYDPRGRLASLYTFRDADSEGDRTTWSYDARGRVVRKTYADGSHVDYAYDGDGRPVSRTSSRGIVSTRTYDAAGRPLSLSFSDGTPSQSYAYDRGGRLVSVTDGAGTRSLSYDSAGNLLSEGMPHVPGKAVARTYDEQGRRTGLALGADLSAAYAYDGLGRLSSVVCGEDAIAFDSRPHGGEAARHWIRNGNEAAAVVTEYDAWDSIAAISFGPPEGEAFSLGYDYDGLGRRTQATLPDGSSWRYTYDRLSQVTSGEKRDASGEPAENGSFRYAYDGAGNRTLSQDGAPNAIRRYGANALNQYTSIAGTGHVPLRGRTDENARVVVTATVDGHSQIYVPSRNGQEFSVDIPLDNSQGEVTATIQVDALKPDPSGTGDLHRRLTGEYTLPAATPQTLAYDADGNLLAGDGWAYAWNGEDRLASAEKDTLRLEFAYDYLGRRFEKKTYENGVLVKHRLFAYDGFQPVAEYDALDDHALLHTFLWQPGEERTPLLLDGNRLYVTDANRNVVALLDPAGEATDTYLYDPFGNVAHTGTSPNPIQFSSEIFDQETGLVYYNYRYYNPKWGRWTKRDPMGEQGGVNLYAFVRNRTLDSVDTLGLKEKISVGKCEILIIYGHYFPSGSSMDGLQNIEFQVDKCAYIVPIGCNTSEFIHPKKMPYFKYPDTQIGWFFSYDGERDMTRGVKAYVIRAKEYAIKIAGKAFGPSPCCCKKVRIKIKAYKYRYDELEEEIVRPIPAWMNTQ